MIDPPQHTKDPHVDALFVSYVIPLLVPRTLVVKAFWLKDSTASGCLQLQPVLDLQKTCMKLLYSHEKYVTMICRALMIQIAQTMVEVHVFMVT
jgi:hypothetical protein